MYPRIVLLALTFVVAYAQEGGLELLTTRLGKHGLRPPPPPEALRRRSFGVQTLWFDQKLDHFDPSNTATWKQRYQTNDLYYRAGGPIFVNINGEGEISISWMTYGQIVVNAKANNALVVQLEHRFYGQSHPTPDFSKSNLKYLTSMQALADLDTFITSLKARYGSPNAKVVVFGGSYSGSLAAYYRLLYPKSTVGAVSSSAPILAKENFFEYVEAVGDALAYFNPQCKSDVRDAFAQIQAAWDSQDSNTLNYYFNLCTPNPPNFTNRRERNDFFNRLIAPLKNKAQYNAASPNSELAQFCSYVTDSSTGSTAVDRFTSWVRENNAGCLYHYSGQYYYSSSDFSWNSTSVQQGSVQWSWQTCNEFAYYGSAESDNHPFGRTLDLSYLEESCQLSFGIDRATIATNVAATNRRYGGLSPNVTNVFFINGSIDPWHRLSVYQSDLNPTSPARFIQGTSHCYDMNEADPWGRDPPGLTQARQDAANAIKGWLQN